MKRLLSLFLIATLICVASVADNIREVAVFYNSATATVQVPPDIKELVSINVNGAEVQATQSADVRDEITYRLSGASQVAHPIPCPGAQPVVYYKGKLADGISLLLHYTTDETTSTVLASEASLTSPYCDMQAEDTIFDKHTFTLGQYTLPYRQANVCTNRPEAPILVLYLHGGTARGNDNEGQLKEPGVTDIYNYLVTHSLPATLIVPQCPAGGGWTSQLRKVVNSLMEQYATDGTHDKNRIYVLGGSMGGTGTWTQLSYFPNFYAAAMPVAGNPTGLDATHVATTPVLTVMGTADVLMSIPAVETFKTSVVAAGGMVILETEEGWSHQNTCEQSYTDERLDWLFSHVKGNSTAIDNIIDNDNSTPAPIYDLCGRRITKPAHGVYIQNGKKYIR